MAFNPTKLVEEKKEKFVPTKLIEDPIDPWARSGYQAVGGAVGGYFSGGSPWGIGLGSAIAGQYWDLAQEITGRKQPESLLQRSIGAAEDVMLDVVSPVALSKGIYGLKKMGHYFVKKPAAKLFRPAQMAKYQQFGVKPSAATATQNPALIRAENALSDFMFSAGPMISKAQFNIEQLKFASEFLAKEYGDILTKEEVGILLKKAAPKALERLSSVYDKMFSRVALDMGNQPQSISNTIETLKTLIKESKLGPDSGVGKLAQEIANKAKTVGGGLPFDALKKHRTKIGDMMKEPALVSTRNIQSGDLKRLYAALTTDMKVAAYKAGPKAHARWRAANKYFETSLQTQVPILEEIMKKGYDQEAFNIIMKGAELGGGRLRALRRQMSQQEWDVVTGSILGNLGKAKPYAQTAEGTMFSLQTFLTNWNKISPQAKKILFQYSSKQRLAKQLDELARVMGDFREVEKLANKSKTGSVLSFFSLMNTIGGSVGMGVGGYAFGGGPGAIFAAGSTAASMTLAPHSLAKLLTNDKFVRWIATGMKIAKTRPDAMKVHLGRLFTIRAKENIKAEIDEFMSLGMGTQP